MSIADEHLATGIAYDVMRLVGRTATTQPRRSRERILLAAVGAEGHTTGLRMIADLAEGHGFDVHFLGAALPVETLAQIVAKHHPEIVGLTVTMAGPAGMLGGALVDHEIMGRVRELRYGLTVFTFNGRGETAELITTSTTSRSERLANDIGIGSTRAAVDRRVPRTRCRVEFGFDHCFIGTFRAGRVVTDFHISKAGRVKRIVVGRVID